MNETLKFSWTHILAFLALIAVSYISFVGYTYLTDGDFMFAIAGAVATDIVFLLVFIGAQILKGAGTRIERKIIWERILIFGSPLIFVGCLVGFAHFWTVRANDADLVHTFSKSINSSKQMFDDYEKYAEARVSAYDDMLSKVISQKKVNPRNFRDAGFVEGKEKQQKENMVALLRLQLLSDNYTTLKKAAYDWIDNSSQGATTWNVFLIGNTREIKSALQDWEDELKGYASKKMSNEEITGSVEPFFSNGALAASEGLDSMSTMFSKWQAPVWTAFFFGAIIYFLLLMPYLIQSPHGRRINAGITLFSNGEVSEQKPRFKPSVSQQEKIDILKSESKKDTSPHPRQSLDAESMDDDSAGYKDETSKREETTTKRDEEASQKRSAETSRDPQESYQKSMSKKLRRRTL